MSAMESEVVCAFITIFIYSILVLSTLLQYIAFRLFVFTLFFVYFFLRYSIFLSFSSLLSYFSMASINSSPYYIASSGRFTKLGKSYIRSYIAETLYPTTTQFEVLSKETGCSVEKLKVNIFVF